MSYKGFTDNPSSFGISDITYDIASNNESADVSAIIATPKLGYMPKSVRLDLEVYKFGNTTIYEILQVTIPLGENQTIAFTVTFETLDVAIISGGGTLDFSVEGIATPIYIGIPLNFIAMDIPTVEVNIIP